MAADPASVVAGGIASGAAVVMLSSMGIHPAVLAWVALGAMAGIAAAGSMPWWRAAIVFVGSVFASALCAQLAARALFGGDELWRNWIGMTLGLFFPTIKRLAEMALPGIFARLLYRVGLGPKPADGAE